MELSFRDRDKAIECHLHTAVVRQSAEAMAAIGDVYMVNSNGPKTEPCGTPVVSW